MSEPPTKSLLPENTLSSRPNKFDFTIYDGIYKHTNKYVSCFHVDKDYQNENHSWRVPCMGNFHSCRCFDDFLSFQFKANKFQGISPVMCWQNQYEPGFYSCFLAPQNPALLLPHIGNLFYTDYFGFKKFLHHWPRATQTSGIVFDSRQLPLEAVSVECMIMHSFMIIHCNEWSIYVAGQFMLNLCSSVNVKYMVNAC